MKTMLIPVDLSGDTDTITRFAAAWANEYAYERIILLHSFYTNIFGHIVLSADYAQVNKDYMQEERQAVQERLGAICKQLDQLTAQRIRVNTAESEAPLLRAIIETMQQEHTDLLVLASDRSKIAAGDGIDVIGIAKASPVKVLIVPLDYNYRPVQHALVPCDFESMESLGKIHSLRTYPEWHDIKLLMLNIDPHEHYLYPDENFRQREKELHGYFTNFSHEFFYSNEPDIISGIIHFTDTHDVQLIIAMPRKHSFLYTLTHKSISSAIYRNAMRPVLILK